MKKLIILVILFSSIFGGTIAFAEDGDKDDKAPDNPPETILDMIDGNNLQTLENEVNAGAENAIRTIRRIGLTVFIIIFILAAYGFMTGGRNPQALQENKGKILWMFAALIIAFGAELIVGAFFSLTGFDPNGGYG
ncbi:TrbC/VirB2 family protein [Chengkuizengella sediminis]|uniref:TrbC/VirB2 family protein n=1 Tax=Chengkuizengella sediminis TaxID=1885917 RepID=UPI00138A65E4|nr:TrbC/VirB2 family protein [Chengkuizengella sediminis]NDI36655.1 hypothetical protein [Chengkuizengella sediminis]